MLAVSFSLRDPACAAAPPGTYDCDDKRWKVRIRGGHSPRWAVAAILADTVDRMKARIGRRAVAQWPALVDGLKVDSISIQRAAWEEMKAVPRTYGRPGQMQASPPTRDAILAQVAAAKVPRNQQTKVPLGTTTAARVHRTYYRQRADLGEVGRREDVVRWRVAMLELAADWLVAPAGGRGGGSQAWLRAVWKTAQQEALRLGLALASFDEVFGRQATAACRGLVRRARKSVKPSTSAFAAQLKHAPTLDELAAWLGDRRRDDDPRVELVPGIRG